MAQAMSELNGSSIVNMTKKQEAFVYMCICVCSSILLLKIYVDKSQGDSRQIGRSEKDKFLGLQGEHQLYNVTTYKEHINPPTGQTENTSIPISKVHIAKPSIVLDQAVVNQSNQEKTRAYNQTKKIILLWTPKLDQSDWGLSRCHFGQCQYNMCTITDDKSLLKEASLLLFYLYEDPNFPDVRYPHQLYGHFTREPPLPPTQETRLEYFTDVINITINYRHDSTIGAPYGVLVKKPVTGEVGYYQPKIPLASRKKSVAWVVSHCRAKSNRDSYVIELRKHIDVDIYGACGNMSCPESRGNSDCLNKIAQEYKFYIAFENNMCRDYFTEKPVYALKYEMIPIVLGNVDYKRLLPPNSFIDVRDFDSPKHLAEYLHYLASNETAFNEYLQYKPRYRMAPPSWVCDMCKFLHTGDYAKGIPVMAPHKQQNMTMTEWWAGPGVCHNEFVDEILKEQT